MPLLGLPITGAAGIGRCSVARARREASDPTAIPLVANLDSRAPAGSGHGVPFTARMLAAAFAVYMIYTEVKTEVRPVKGGIPCKVASGPAGTVLTLWRSRIGSRTSYNAALRAVEEEAARLVTCSGNCRTGRCQPVPIVISAIPKYRVFWTTTVVTYMVGCACI